MAEEIKIRISSEGADQVERELQKLQQAGQQASSSMPGGGGGSGGAPPSPPDPPDGPRGPGWTPDLLHPPIDHKAIGAQKLREYKERSKADLEDAQEAAQDELNEQLVRDEEKRQNAGARKAKADDLRAARREQSRAITEDRMQEQLNHQLVREEEKQQRAEAVESARSGALHGAASAISGMGGANPFSGVTGLAAGMGGPMAIGAEVAGMVLASMSAQADRSRGLELMQLGSAANLAAGARAATRMGGPMGSAEAAGEAAYGAGEAGQQILDRMPQLAREAESKWNSIGSIGSWFNNKFIAGTALDRMLPASMQGGMQSFEGEAAINEANATHHEQMVSAHAERVAARVQWERIGAKVLRARELRESGDWRGAKDMEYDVLWQREFDGAWKQGAGMSSEKREAMAEHSADLAKAAAVREESMKFAHLIGVNSSRSQIARVQALAAGELHGHAHHQHATVSALEELVRMNREHHGESVLRRFEPRSLRNQGGHS